MSEPAIQRSQPLRRAIVVVLVLYWIAAFAATHAPVPHLQDLPKNSDKWAHFVVYSGLAFLLGLLFMTARPLRLKTYAVIFAITVAYSVVDELLQIPVNRHADFADGAADAIGSITGLIALYLLQPLLTRRWKRAD